MHQQFDDPAFQAILDRHHIPQQFWPAFYQLAEHGTLSDHAFRDRLNDDFGFKAASEEIVEFIAAPYSSLFSPTTPYESLDEGDFITGVIDMSAAPVLDFFGRQIKAGDTVVYPGRQGASMWLSRMNVTQVVAGDRPKLNGYSNEGRKIAINVVNKTGKIVVAVVNPLPPATA